LASRRRCRVNGRDAKNGSVGHRALCIVGREPGPRTDRGGANRAPGEQRGFRIAAGLALLRNVAKLAVCQRHVTCSRNERRSSAPRVHGRLSGVTCRPGGVARHELRAPLGPDTQGGRHQQNAKTQDPPAQAHPARPHGHSRSRRLKMRLDTTKSPTAQPTDCSIASPTCEKSEMPGTSPVRSGRGGT
jgi:hypothetical protein